MSDDFQWDELDKAAKVVNEARETVVYLNPEGDVVIRQRKNWPNEQEDPAVVIPLYRVRALIDRLDIVLLDSHRNHE